jgi:hypothetical protein
MNRRAEEHLLNPPPGSAAARARDFGIDLTLLIQRLRLTPEERLLQLQRVMAEMEAMRAGLRRREGRADDTSRTDTATVNTTSG